MHINLDCEKLWQVQKSIARELDHKIPLCSAWQKNLPLPAHNTSLHE